MGITGGAPLSPETHEFIRTCMDIELVQGYGLTEASASGCIMEEGDTSVGTVGAPMAGVDLKLINWDEGNYKVSDQPRPRGEIVFGGGSIAKGYYKNETKTQEEFFHLDGKRWFRTGDIGELFPNGSIRIIDRKKDLVKLQLGEYVSLGKVESQLKTHPLVENICVYGDSYQLYTVALMVPIQQSLEKLASDLGKTYEDYRDLCTDSEIVQAVLKTLDTYGVKTNLEKFEIPKQLTLIPEAWTPESGLVTAAFKLKRQVIKSFFHEEIHRMYG